MEAYVHGIVIDCADGIRRRVYPRLFTYSADYPEKSVEMSLNLTQLHLTSYMLYRVLIASLRDKGRCPCPRCLIEMDNIPALGTEADRRIRQDHARVDSHARQELVTRARDSIYNRGLVVNSKVVDDLLKPESLVPTKVRHFLRNEALILIDTSQNTFSNRLLDHEINFFLMLVVDLLHEFELGVWKAVFTHLIRILEAHNPAKVNELDSRCDIL